MEKLGAPVLEWGVEATGTIQNFITKKTLKEQAIQLITVYS